MWIRYKVSVGDAYTSVFIPHSKLYETEDVIRMQSDNTLRRSIVSRIVGRRRVWDVTFSPKYAYLFETNLRTFWRSAIQEIHPTATGGNTPSNGWVTVTTPSGQMPKEYVEEIAALFGVRMTLTERDMT